MVFSKTTFLKLLQENAKEALAYIIACDNINELEIDKLLDQYSQETQNV